ncbi:hypothetical protein QQF64_010983 [Cirrhinus molitorella]|uniref:Uncharacterized protein n=1 Tax=Cirrhinus molitorella TaxID=172907 RepID=A0ABR3M109_9TELE
MSRICNKNSNSFKDFKNSTNEEWKRRIPSRKKKKKKKQLLRLLSSSLCHWLLKEPYPERRKRYRERKKEGGREKERWMVTPSSPGTSERLKKRKKERERERERGGGGQLGWLLRKPRSLSSAVPKRSYLNRVRVAATTSISVCECEYMRICVAPH